MMKDGIYFRLSEEEYLAEERLSKSGIKRIRISPADFWFDSWLNPTPPVLTPEQERARAAAKVIGRAYHCARLEPERFAAIYLRELSQAEMPAGSLFTADAMKDEIRTRNEGREKADTLKLSGSTEEIALRLAEDGFPREQLWHLALADWRKGVAFDAVTLAAGTFDEIAVDMERMRAAPAINARLSGGFAEVSVLYTCPETGIPMKARFDYLRHDGWTELKTFANPAGKPLFQAITDAIRFNRYYIDAVSYRDVAEVVRSGVVDIAGDPFADEVALIQAIRERAEEMECHFIFQQKGGVPNALERRFRFWRPTGSEEAIADLEASGASEDHLRRARHMQEISDANPVRTMIHNKGRLEIAAAKDVFLAYSEIYERGEPWLPFNPSGEIGDLDFNPHWLEEGVS